MIANVLLNSVGEADVGTDFTEHIIPQLAHTAAEKPAERGKIFVEFFTTVVTYMRCPHTFVADLQISILTSTFAVGVMPLSPRTFNNNLAHVIAHV
jgi:hypothetical protein